MTLILLNFLDVLAQATPPAAPSFTDEVLRSVLGSGPMAVVLGFAVWYQTKKLEKAEEKNEKLHDEVLDLFRGIGGAK